jgi:hypothetical protein
MTLNERLAIWAGWEKHSVTEVPVWWSPIDHCGYSELPAYNTSIDLIRRDLLPRLSEEQWDWLDMGLEDKWDRALVSEPHPEYLFSRFLLTFPPADLAAAIAEVVHAAE